MAVNNWKSKMIPRMCIHLPYFLKSCPSPRLLISTSSQVHVWVQKDMTVAQMFPKSTELRHHPRRAPVEVEERKFVLDKVRPSLGTSWVYSPSGELLWWGRLSFTTGVGQILISSPWILCLL